MVWIKNACKEMAKSKSIFVTIYKIVLIGVFLTAFYVFFAVFSSNNNNNSKSTSYAYSSSASRLDFISEAPTSSPSKDAGTYPTSSLKSRGIVLKPIWVSPPLNEEMPPLETFRLTKELVGKRVKDNVIIVTFGNYAFMDFILTWVKHLTDLGLFNLLVGAMDTKLLEALYRKGIPVFDMQSNISTDDVGWGSPMFHKIGREKVFLINTLLPFGYELLMCDSDMVWLKNPLPYFARFPEADILTSTDQIVPSAVDDRLDEWQQDSRLSDSTVYNIGIFHWRPTDSSKKLATEWKAMLLANDKIWDQYGFNYIVRKQLGPSVDGESGLVYAYDGNLKLGLLPNSIFCSGHSYFVQAMPQQFKLQPYAVHTTFQFAGTVGKRHRLREAMMFYDPPEYYNSPGGFLSFKPSIPRSLLFDGEHNVVSHVALVNHQIKQIRTALAIASLLNRTLVMPPIWCRLDRLYTGHNAIIQGTVTRQPFICPLDHVFQVYVMVMDMLEKDFGPNIDFREYSFLDNPSLPQEVRESWLDVNLCQEGSDDCRLTNNSRSPRLIKLPKNSSEEAFTALFSPFKDIKVVNFLSVQDAFLGFTDEEREQKFRDRLTWYLDLRVATSQAPPEHP